MRSYILPLFAVLSLTASAQPSFDWLRVLGGNEDQSVEEVKWSIDGNLIHVGSFEDEILFGPMGETVFSAGEKDIFLSKRNDDGVTQWSTSFGGPGLDEAAAVDEDSDGNLYIIGSFSDSLTIDTTTIYSEGATDILVIKLDSLGTPIWHFQVGSDQLDVGKDISVDEQGRVSIVFEFWNTATYTSAGSLDSLVSNGSLDVGVMQLGPSGQVNWKIAIGNVGASDGVESIDVDSLNNVYVFGQFRDDLDFDTGVGVDMHTAWGRDLYLLKLTPNGDYVWNKQMGAISEEWVEGLEIEGDDIIMTGHFKGFFSMLDFNTDTTIYAAGHYDCFVAKCNLDGEFEWIRAIGGLTFDTALAAVVSEDDEVYVTGLVTDSVDIDPTEGVQMESGMTSRRTAYIQKLSPEGEFIWASILRGDADTYLTSIDIKDGLIAYGGAFKGQLDVAPFSDIVYATTDLSQNSGLIVLLRECFEGIEELTITNCGPYELNGNVYAQSGVYMDSLYTLDGCINVTQLDLTVIEGTTAVDNQSACDSLVLSGVTYYESDLVELVYAAVNGCDSIINWTLNIGQSNASNIDVTACNSYEHDGQVYEQSGMYQQVLSNMSGCDSLLTINLQIDTLDLSVIDDSPLLIASQVDANYQWLDCTDDYSPIAGATDSSYMAAANGSYAVSISQGACADTTACVDVLNIGLWETAERPVWSVYPNPSQGQVQIIGLEHSAQLELYDAAGRLVHYSMLTSNQQFIDLSDLPAGLYTVMLTDRQGRSSSRLSLRN